MKISSCWLHFWGKYSNRSLSARFTGYFDITVLFPLFFRSIDVHNYPASGTFGDIFRAILRIQPAAASVPVYICDSTFVSPPKSTIPPSPAVAVVVVVLTCSSTSWWLQRDTFCLSVRRSNTPSSVVPHRCVFVVQLLAQKIFCNDRNWTTNSDGQLAEFRPSWLK